MDIVCLDLEGVLVPEIWVEVAEATGIGELKATTRDIPDYNVLMDQRLGLLDKNGLDLAAIQAVIDGIDPLDGAKAFLDELRRDFQVVILSDTFYEVARPLMRRRGWPTLFCHHLETGGDDKAGGTITGYKLRLEDHKRQAVRAFRELNFRVTAAGDSYNDTNMLDEADRGILFRAPDNVTAEFPEFQRAETYAELLQAITGPEGA